MNRSSRVSRAIRRSSIVAVALVAALAAGCSASPPEVGWTTEAPYPVLYGPATAETLNHYRGPCARDIACIQAFMIERWTPALAPEYQDAFRNMVVCAEEMCHLHEGLTQLDGLPPRDPSSVPGYCFAATPSPYAARWAVLWPGEKGCPVPEPAPAPEG